MDADALVQWKTRIAIHQQRAKENQPEQGTLFDVAKAHVDPSKIDPFHREHLTFAIKLAYQGFWQK